MESFGWRRLAVLWWGENGRSSVVERFNCFLAVVVDCVDWRWTVTVRINGGKHK